MSFILIILLSIYSLSLWSRVSIRQSVQLIEGKLPFTQESAFLFYFSKKMAEGDPIPALDFKAQFPEGFDARRKLSLTPDFVLAFLYRHVFQHALSYEEFIRWIQPIFLSLSSLLIFLWSYRIRKNLLQAVFASLLYGLSLSSMIRSTGIEYSRENLALPLIFLHFVLSNLFNGMNLGVRLRHRPKLPWQDTGNQTSSSRPQKSPPTSGDKGGFIPQIAISSIAAVSLLIATLFWDGTQTYFLAWTLFEWINSFLRLEKNLTSRIRERNRFLIHLLIFVNVSLIHPYLKDHSFIFSPGVSLLFILTLSRPFQVRFQRYILLGALPLCALIYFISAYFGTYEHMARLIFYKLKFLNQKPSDPLLLPFDVRMLWTPALHALSLDKLKLLLPLLGLCVPAIVSIWKDRYRHSLFLLFFFTAFLILSTFLVRLEVYLIFFLACLIGTASIGSGQRSRKTLVWNFLVFLVLLFEAEQVTKDISRYRRPVPYPYLNSLVQWIKENTPKNSIFLANFGLSPSILMYADRGITLQPKYESKDIREKVFQFTRSLFCSDEKLFYQFCIDQGDRYYVHAVGTFQDTSVYSWRYMAGIDEVPAGTPAESFEYDVPLRNFYKVFSNGKYIVYRILRPEDLKVADRWTKKGDGWALKGDDFKAQKCYVKSLTRDPNHFLVYFKLAKLYHNMNLQDKALEATKEGLRLAHYFQSRSSS